MAVRGQGGAGRGHWRRRLQEWTLGGLRAWGRRDSEGEEDVKQCVCPCTCVHTRVCMHVCMLVCMCMHTCVYMLTRLHVHGMCARVCV